MAFHLPLQLASASFGLLFGNFADGSCWMYLGPHHWFCYFDFMTLGVNFLLFVYFHHCLGFSWFSWVQDRPAFGTGNGKWCKNFLYTTSNTVLLRWSGLGWLGFGSWDAELLSAPYELHEAGTDTLWLLVFSYYWNFLSHRLVHLVNIPFDLPSTQKPHAVLKRSKIAACFMLSVHIPDEINAQHAEAQLRKVGGVSTMFAFRLSIRWVLYLMTVLCRSHSLTASGFIAKTRFDRRWQSLLP